MGANIQDFIGQNILGRILSSIFDRHKTDAARGAQPTTNPLDNVPNRTPQQVYESLSSQFRNEPSLSATYGQPGGQTISRDTFQGIQQGLGQYTDSSGNIDWDAAQRAGALQDLGFGAGDVNREQIAQQGYQDIETAYQAALQDQLRAMGLAGNVLTGFGDVFNQLDSSRGAADQRFGELQSQLNQTREMANQMPGQVREANAAQMASFQQFQAQQMQQLQELISQGLDSLSGERAEAINNIAQNLSRDVSAELATTRANYRAQASQIMGDPSLQANPALRAQLLAQVNQSAHLQAKQQSAKLTYASNQLETATRTQYSQLNASLQAAGQAATSGLAGQQQTARGQLYGQHGQQYAAALDARSRIGQGLAEIFSTASAQRGILDSQLNALHLQAEATQDEILRALLPEMSTPFAVYTPLMQEIYGMAISEGALQRGIETEDFNREMLLQGYDTQLQNYWAQGLQQNAAFGEQMAQQYKADQHATNTQIAGYALAPFTYGASIAVANGMNQQQQS